jgi:hypothetical protein
MTGIHRTTIQNLLVDLGKACSEYQDKVMRNLKCKRIQCDEIWAFVGCKARMQRRNKRLRDGTKFGLGLRSVLIRSSVLAKYVVTPDASAAYHFIHDLAERLAYRVQLTADGHKPCLSAVEDAFGAEIDYAQLVKIYGNEQQHGEVRYSSAVCMGVRVAKVAGKPDYAHISTSMVERKNLTMRMGMRRFTHLTNAFSKKVENLEAAVALHYRQHNFARVHQTLRVPPAMEAGIVDHV